MRYVIGILLWVGLIRTVQEWRHARKHRLAITRTEKVSLAMVFPVFFGAQLMLDLMGVAPGVATTVSGLGMGLALNAWATQRRLHRPR